APTTPASYADLGSAPIDAAASYSRVRSVSNIAGSSVEMEHRTPASSRCGSGWSASDCTAPVRTFETGQTSRTIRRSPSSASRSRSSIARIPWRMRSAPRASSAPRIEAGPAPLPGVGHRAEAFCANALEHRCVVLRRVFGLEAAEADADHAAIAVFDGIPQHLIGLLVRSSSKDVGRKANLDTVELAGLPRAVAVAAEHRLPVDTAACPLGRREDPFDVDGAVLGGFRGVVDHDLVEVVAALQRVRREDPALDEGREGPVLIELCGAADGVGRKRVVVTPRDLEQRVRPHGPLQVDVELDFRQGYSGPSVPAAAHRFSSATDSQIESSNRIQSGATSKASETGSTVGSRIAAPSRMTYASFRLRRNWAVVNTPMRTSATTKIGSWNTRPVAKIISPANER